MNKVRPFLNLILEIHSQHRNKNCNLNILVWRIQCNGLNFRHKFFDRKIIRYSRITKNPYLRSEVKTSQIRKKLPSFLRKFFSKSYCSMKHAQQAFSMQILFEKKFKLNVRFPSVLVLRFLLSSLKMQE